MIHVELNGQRTEVPDNTTVEELIASMTGSLRGSAVVVDGEVVPRSAWPARLLSAGQRIELITAVQGG